jgi:hypothetical protein
VELLHGDGGDGHVAVVGRGGIHRHHREQHGVTVVSRNGQGGASAGSGVSGWIASRRQQRGSAASASSSSSNASSNTLASAYSGISAPPSPGLLSLGLGFQLGLGLGDAEGEEADTCEGDEEAAGQNDVSQGSVSGAGRGRLASAATSDTYNYFHGLPLPPSTATVGGNDDAASATGSEGAVNNSLEYGRAGAGDDADAERASTTRLGRRSRASRPAETARASVASNPYSRPYGTAAGYDGEEGEGDDGDEGDAEDEEAASVAGQRSRLGGIASRGRIARSGKGKGPLSGPNTRAQRALLPLPPAVGGWQGAGEAPGSGGAGGSMLSPGAAGLGITDGEPGSDSGLLARRQVKRPRKLQVGEGEGGETEHANAPQTTGPLLAPAAVNAAAASALSARGGQHAQAQAAGLAAVGGSLFSPCVGYPLPTPQHAGLAGLPSTTAAASRTGNAAAAGLHAPHTSAGGSPPAPESPIFTPHASSGSGGRQTAAYTNVSNRVVGVAGGLPADAGSATRTGTGALTFPASTMARLSGLSLASPQPVQHQNHGGAGAAAAAARALADATAREDAGVAAGTEAASRLVHPPLPPLDTANALAGSAAALATSRAGSSGLGLLTMLHAQYRQAPAAGAAAAGTQAGAASHSGGVPGAAPSFMAGLPGYLFAPTPAHGVPRGSALPGMGGLPSTRAGGVVTSGSCSAQSSAASTSAASSASSGSALGASFAGLGLSLMSPAGSSSGAGGASGGFQSGYGLLSSMAAGSSGGGVWGANPLSMFSSTHLMQQQQQRQVQGQVQRPGADGGAGDASVSRTNAMDVSAFLSSGAFSTRHMAGAGGLPSTTAASVREAAASSWIAAGSGFAPPSPPASAAGLSAFRPVAAAAVPAAQVPAPVSTQAPAAAPTKTAAAAPASASASSAFTSPLAATLGVQLTVAPAVAVPAAPQAVSTAAPGGKLLSPSLFHLSSALSPALFSPGLAHTCLSATAAAAVNRSKARMASVAGGAAAASASGGTGATGGEGVTPSGHRAMQSAARRDMRHSHQGAAAGEDDGAESSTSASSSESTGR